MEYSEHRQCQTCLLQFNENRALLDHIEEFRTRERQLLAELERCRMHIAQLDNNNIHSGKEDDNDLRTELDERHVEDDGLDTEADGCGADVDECDEEDEGYGDDDEHDLLVCPFKGCKRTKSFTERSNLIRHFQQHVVCNEICPSCHKAFTAVRKFIRHKCKSNSASVLLVQRREHIIRNVRTELDLLQSHERQTRKRGYKDPCSESGQPQKMAKTGYEIAMTLNAHLQPNTSADSIGTDRQILYASETSRTENSTQWTLPETTTVMPAAAAEFSLHSDTDTGIIPISNNRWASIDNGWAYASVATEGTLENNGWAYALVDS